MYDVRWMNNSTVEDRRLATSLVASLTTESLALVLPTLQEAATIEAMIRSIVPVLDSLCVDYEVVVVDDASSDETPAIVRRLLTEFPQLRLVERRGERGLSGAILDGWAGASATVVGVIDADFQHPPELLATLWEAIEQGADLVVASRYAHGATMGTWRWLRRVTSSAAVLLCRPLQVRSCLVEDPMSGFFMIRRGIVLDLPGLQRSGFKLLLDILVRARLEKVQEVPFRFGLRQGGKSKANAAVLRDYFLLLMRLYWARLTGSGSRSDEGGVLRDAPTFEETRADEL
jgi:dolichol-phosphate mannosyltransferase